MKKKPTKFTTDNCVKLSKHIALRMDDEQLRTMVANYLYADMAITEKKFRLNLKLHNVEHWK